MYKFSKMFGVVLMIMIQESNQQLMITPLNNSGGIYFENLGPVYLLNGEWKLYVHLNMTDYWNKNQQLQDLTTKIINLCNLMSTQDDQICTVIIGRLKQQLSEIHQLNDSFLRSDSSSLRKKRSPFDIIGSLAHSLFGVLDHEYAKEIEAKIEGTKADQNQLLELLREQTSVIESVVTQVEDINNNFEAQQNMIQNQIESLADQITKVEKQLSVHDLLFEMTLITNVAIIMLFSFRRQQDMLIDLLVDLHHGKINPTFLPPPVLINELMRIEPYVPSDLTTPPPKDVTNLFKALYFTAGVTASSIIMEIKIPLYKREEFTLYKVHPVPIIIKQEMYMLKLNVSYFVSNIYRTHVRTISSTELKDCIKMLNGKLCRNNRPFFGKESKTYACELRIFNQEIPSDQDCQLESTGRKEMWIQLQHSNTWIVGVLAPVSIEIICQNTSQTRALSSLGLLQLQPDCILKHPTMIIEANPVYTSYLSASISPKVNISHLFKNKTSGDFGLLQENVHKINFTVETKTTHLQNLTNKVQQLKNLYTEQNSQFQSHSVHHVHHYTVIYGTIGCVLFLIILFIRLQCLAKRKLTPQVRPSARIWNFNHESPQEPTPNI